MLAALAAHAAGGAGVWHAGAAGGVGRSLPACPCYARPLEPTACRPQCLYLRGAFALAEGPAGAAIREGLLSGVVEHLIAIDVEIRCVAGSASQGRVGHRRTLVLPARSAARRQATPTALHPPTHPLPACLATLPACRWEDIAEAQAAEERREEEGGLPPEDEPDIFELEGEAGQGWVQCLPCPACLPAAVVAACHASNAAHAAALAAALRSWGYWDAHPS